MTTERIKFYRLGNGGWGCEIDGVRFTFFKPAPGVPFKGVDFKGDWWCKAYFAAEPTCVRAATREEGIRELRAEHAQLSE